MLAVDSLIPKFYCIELWPLIWPYKLSKYLHTHAYTIIYCIYSGVYTSSVQSDPYGVSWPRLSGDDDHRMTPLLCNMPMLA